MFTNPWKRIRTWDPLCDERIHCVYVTGSEHEFSFFASFLTHAGILLHRAQTVEQADFLLVVTDASVLICDPRSLDGAWEAADRMLASFHPAVSLIVVAEEEGAPIERGTPVRPVAVLPRPLRLREFQKTIAAADTRARKLAVRPANR